ncbi:hypothetical protein QQF64_036097 [Cirrhinus molitorella]|uniref:Uncharacterized protein n=1 Tax=Cirrhinus molitorella TaxID=172907 RepID=A0ABR3NHR5_9TELE
MLATAAPTLYQSQNPEAKLERYHRKRRRDDRPFLAANLCVPPKSPKQECSMDHYPVSIDSSTCPGPSEVC